MDAPVDLAWAGMRAVEMSRPSVQRDLAPSSASVAIRIFRSPHSKPRTGSRSLITWTASSRLSN